MSDTEFSYQPVADDSGPSQIVIAPVDGRVVMTLTEPMQWVGMTPTQAAYIAVSLMRAAVGLDPSLEDGLPDNDTPLVN